MGILNLLGIHQGSEILADDVAVGISGDVYSAELELNSQKNRTTVMYHTGTTGGSARISLEYSIGQDVNGADVWIEAASSTATTDAFYLERPAEKLRLRFQETGGVAGYSGVNATAKTSAL